MQGLFLDFAGGDLRIWSEREKKIVGIEFSPPAVCVGVTLYILSRVCMWACTNTGVMVMFAVCILYQRYGVCLSVYKYAHFTVTVTHFGQIILYVHVFRYRYKNELEMWLLRMH